MNKLTVAKFGTIFVDENGNINVNNFTFDRGGESFLPTQKQVLSAIIDHLSKELESLPSANELAQFDNLAGEIQHHAV
jgi:membrane-associated PAP2 superfamily phosphatase